MYNGIIITGTSCAGKSSIAQLLCNQNMNLFLAKAITTREKRKDDIVGNYEYISRSKFDEYMRNNELIVYTLYKGEYFGILFSEIKNIMSNNRIPLLVIAPASLSMIKLNPIGYNFLSFFIDADDFLLSERYAKRNEKECDESFVKQNNEDRAFIKDAKYFINNVNLEFSLKQILNTICSDFAY